MGIYIYVFSCDVNGNKQMHHRDVNVVCWDGSSHLAWSIVTILVLLFYYPLSALTWPFLQMINHSDTVKQSPCYLFFFSSVKLLILSSSAFLKNSYTEKVARMVLIFAMFLISLIIAVVVLPCRLRGLNWLLIMLLCCCVWVSSINVALPLHGYIHCSGLSIGDLSPDGYRYWIYYFSILSSYAFDVSNKEKSSN